MQIVERHRKFTFTAIGRANTEISIDNSRKEMSIIVDIDDYNLSIVGHMTRF